MPSANGSNWRRRTKAGLCGNCGKQPAIQYETLCAVCKECLRYGQTKYRKTHTLELSDRARNRYVTRKESGLCTACGQLPPIDGETLCPGCKKLRQEANLRYRQKQRKRGKNEN